MSVELYDGHVLDDVETAVSEIDSKLGSGWKRKDEAINEEVSAGFVAEMNARYANNSPGAKHVTREGAPRQVNYKPHLGL